jgi:hypothetical protein
MFARRHGFIISLYRGIIDNSIVNKGALSEDALKLKLLALFTQLSTTLQILSIF